MIIISYSCRCLPNKASKLRHSAGDKLDDDDIDSACLQQTWFTKQDLGYLNMLHSDFHGTKGCYPRLQKSYTWGTIK